jgi:Trk K+ transport system NAD-binding subunit
MNSVFFLALRRMRAPLIVLIVAHAVAVLGLVLMPGVNAEGQAEHLSFFHALYVISYTATTIGFGEVPYPFSNAQRLWLIFSIYLSVIAWAYAIGKLLALVQDKAFRQVLAAKAFARSMRHLHAPFYLVCGYGETGSLLLEGLTEYGKMAVVLDINPDRLSELDLQDYPVYIPGLCADAREPETLLQAGVGHPLCQGVVALTNDDQANLSIAATVKLLRPDLPVMSRAESLEAAATLRTFGAESVINPYETFGAHLAMAIHNPGLYVLHAWLARTPDTPLMHPLRPPAGKWIVCGYGRFGKAMVRHLTKEGVETLVVDAHPEENGCKDCIRKKDTEEETLLAADIANAAGIVAGTDNDISNLSLAMAGQRLNPELFTVVRKNRRSNSRLFDTFGAHLTIQPSHVTAEEILYLLTAPMLSRFFFLSYWQDNDWANQLISRISGVVREDTVPDIWEFEISAEEAGGAYAHLRGGGEIRLLDLLRDPTNREQRLSCIPLLLVRGNESILLPEDNTLLHKGDQLLFCGSRDAHYKHPLLVENQNVFDYALTGIQRPSGSIWRWAEQALSRR